MVAGKEKRRWSRRRPVREQPYGGTITNDESRRCDAARTGVLIMAKKPTYGWATKPGGAKVHVNVAETERKQPVLPPDPSCQPCPDCGGLECLCRPRFFAGQLLTEQDLNRLDHYITEKHKLHNRHLFGSGVVCGLVVTCAPCDERVNVSPGYALSACGEDIVVCKPDSVDICALIARCRDDVDPDCRPYGGGDSCDDVEEEWVLALRYVETPSMPRTPVVGPAVCA